MKLLSSTSLLAKSFLLTLLGGLTACSNNQFTHYDDSAPDRYVDVSHVGNAIPRREKRSPYGNPASYQVNGQRYFVLNNSKGYRARGMASWYGTKFHGKRTSSGEPYNMYAMTAAHKTLPLPTYVRVTNIRNGKVVVVKVNDRGPFIKGRIIDLSYVAARKLGITGQGTGYVEVETIEAENTVVSRPKPVVAKTVSQTNSNLYLQVGLFSERENAELLKTNLMQLPLPTIRITTDTTNTRPMYRVRIGPVSGDSEAEQLIELLARQGHKGFRIRVD